ncbi:hypothetical protein [Teichococcus aestuarii]|uniref:hypothetical protein n=1 Tax=Teichococcus aestuarii TaxID=568898 RepID=UPI0011B213DF|nr:hypothetical protein [Pseudoroseomonas aestuarii]
MYAGLTSPVIVACRRGIAALLCVFMLLTTMCPVGCPADLTLEAGSSLAGQVEVLALNDGSDDPPMAPDTLPCHAAHHVCSKVAPLSPEVVAGFADEAGRQIMPTPLPTRVLLSGVLEFPTKPPRA